MSWTSQMKKIKGYSECSSLSCSESSSRHRLETLNTEKFMSNLATDFDG